MPKHNYSQYSDKKKNIPNKTVAPKPAVSDHGNVAFVEDMMASENITTVSAPVEPMEIKMAVETVDTVTLPKNVKGVVSNCAKLNVRAEPNVTADIVSVLDNNSEINIDVAKSDKNWFYVCTAAGIEGYCMRKFVNAKL